MAHLSLECCSIAEDPSASRPPLGELAPRPVCKQHLPGARVRLDDVDAGMCVDWAGAGRLVRAGGHRIDVEAAPARGNELETCDCEGGASAYVILREGEVQTKFIAITLRRYDLRE